MARLPHKAPRAAPGRSSASNSESLSGRNASPTVSPTWTALLDGSRALTWPLLGDHGDDLRRAEIFGAEHAAAQPRRYRRTTRARAARPARTCLRHDPRTAPAFRSATPSTLMRAIAAPQRRLDVEKVHRRRADEVGHEHVLPDDRRSPAACRSARRGPAFMTAMRSAIAIASSWSCVT